MSASSLNEGTSGPYWNSECSKYSALLASITSNQWQLNKQSVHTGSWFSIESLRPSLDKKSNPQLGTDIVIRSRKIRIYPTRSQREVLRQWFGSSRYCFNTAIEFLKHPATTPNWKEVKTFLIHCMPQWLKKTPYEIKTVAIRDACVSIRNAKVKATEAGKWQEVRHRSRKSSSQVLFIPKTAVTSKGVFHTKLGKLFASEKIPKAEHDCRLVLQRDRYFLIVPINVKKQVSKNQAGVIALDPGLRTFLTSYDGNRVEKIGTAAFSRIVRLCHALDVLTRDREAATGTRKRRMKKAQNRLRNRIADSISELHHKVAATLTSEYKVVIIPEFNFHLMAQSLFRKTVRGLATLAHGRFRQILATHAEKRGCKIVFQNEAYTSKTCSSCGQIQKIGAKLIWKCTNCQHCHDRDANGARGIFLRALVDTPWTQKYVSCIPS